MEKSMEQAPWLLVGLGNPGAKYAKHRHNVGFLAVDAWVDAHAAGAAWREKWHALYTTGPVSGHRVVVLKPQTFMNRSGKSVVAAAGFYRVPPKQIVVVHDELDFEFGRVAVKNGGGHGGHNGLRDIVELLGSRDFIRIRTGIGRPPKGRDPSGWVLSDFDAHDAAELPDVLDRIQAAATTVITDGVAAAMNKFNTTPKAGAASAT